MSNDLIRVAQNLKFLSQALQDKITPLLKEHHEAIEDLQRDMRLLLEIEEMDTYVNARASMEGVFDLEEDTPENRQEAFNRLMQLREEYLATVAIARFLSPSD